MKQFSKKVDTRSRKAMIEFLTGHFRYDTANGWNRSTSYAHNLKIYNLGLTSEQESKLLDLMDCDEPYEEIADLIYEFNSSHGFKWQAGFNGRSGGYLVLYQGGQRKSEWKSYCTSCGQKNYRAVEENGCKCGRCSKETRRNLEEALMQVFTCPGKSTDMYEDFEDWSMDELRARVKLVQEFDRLADDIVDLAAYMADNYTVEEEEYFVPATRKVAVGM